MHIEEPVLAASASGMVVLAGGAVIAAAGTALGLRRLDYERVPQVAMLSAVFFVASLIHVPVGVTSVHLVLNGLMGLVLGWAAFPAILVALFLQVLFFSFGGLTTLGVNTVIMALPAVAVYCLFHRAVRCRHETAALGAGFLAGAVAIVFAALLQMGAILSVGQSFERLAQVALIAHLPVAAVEGFVTAGAVLFLRRVRPELLDVPLLMPVVAESSDG